MKQAATYLTFNGNCRQAMQFYASSLEAELQLATFGEMPGPDGKPAPKDLQDKIMHARLAKGPVVLMASDNMPGRPFQQGNNFSIAIKPTSSSTRWRKMARPLCRCRRPSGQPALACLPTSSGSIGCSTWTNLRTTNRPQSLPGFYLARVRRCL